MFILEIIQKKGTGFFIEANASVMQVENDFYYDYIWPDGNNGVIKNNDWNFGLGASAGGKFLAKNGFVGEIYIGVGRFFNKKNSIEAYPRVGITIGKRF